MAHRRSSAPKQVPIGGSGEWLAVRFLLAHEKFPPVYSKRRGGEESNPHNPPKMTSIRVRENITLGSAGQLCSGCTGTKCPRTLSRASPSKYKTSPFIGRTGCQQSGRSTCPSDTWAFGVSIQESADDKCSEGTYGGCKNLSGPGSAFGDNAGWLCAPQLNKGNWSNFCSAKGRTGFEFELIADRSTSRSNLGWGDEEGVLRNLQASANEAEPTCVYDPKQFKTPDYVNDFLRAHPREKQGKDRPNYDAIMSTMCTQVSGAERDEKDPSQPLFPLSDPKFAVCSVPDAAACAADGEARCARVEGVATCYRTPAPREASDTAPAGWSTSSVEVMTAMDRKAPFAMPTISELASEGRQVVCNSAMSQSYVVEGGSYLVNESSMRTVVDLSDCRVWTIETYLMEVEEFTVTIHFREEPTVPAWLSDALGRYGMGNEQRTIGIAVEGREGITFHEIMANEIAPVPRASPNRGFSLVLPIRWAGDGDGDGEPYKIEGRYRPKRISIVHAPSKYAVNALRQRSTMLRHRTPSQGAEEERLHVVTLDASLPEGTLPESRAQTLTSSNGRYDRKGSGAFAATRTRYVQVAVDSFHQHPSLRFDVYVDGELQSTPERARSYSGVWDNDSSRLGQSGLDSSTSWSGTKFSRGSSLVESGHPEWAMLDLGRVRNVTGIKILPRKDADQYATAVTVNMGVAVFAEATRNEAVIEKVYATLGRSAPAAQDADPSLPQPTPRTYLKGGVNDGIEFSVNGAPLIGAEYTICVVARYGGARRQRIFDAKEGNWLHGFHRGHEGVAHYDAWKTSPKNKLAGGSSWLIFSGDNRGDDGQLFAANLEMEGDDLRNYAEQECYSWANKLWKGKGCNGCAPTVCGNPSCAKCPHTVPVRRGGTGNKTLTINAGRSTGERSDWEVRDVIVWNRNDLSDDERLQVHRWLGGDPFFSTVPDALTGADSRLVAWWKAEDFPAASGSANTVWSDSIRGNDATVVRGTVRRVDVEDVTSELSEVSPPDNPSLYTKPLADSVGAPEWLCPVGNYEDDGRFKRDMCSRLALSNFGDYSTETKGQVLNDEAREAVKACGDWWGQNGINLDETVRSNVITNICADPQEGGFVPMECYCENADKTDAAGNHWSEYYHKISKRTDDVGKLTKQPKYCWWKACNGGEWRNVIKPVDYDASPQCPNICVQSISQEAGENAWVSDVIMEMDCKEGEGDEDGDEEEEEDDPAQGEPSEPTEEDDEEKASGDGSQRADEGRPPSTVVDFWQKRSLPEKVGLGLVVVIILGLWVWAMVAAMRSTPKNK